MLLTRGWHKTSAALSSGLPSNLLSPFTRSLDGEMRTLGRLIVLALPALAFAQFLLECQAIEKVVSGASTVYYPGEHERLPRR